MDGGVHSKHRAGRGRRSKKFKPYEGEMFQPRLCMHSPRKRFTMSLVILLTIFSFILILMISDGEYLHQTPKNVAKLQMKPRDKGTRYTQEKKDVLPLEGKMDIKYYPTNDPQTSLSPDTITILRRMMNTQTPQLPVHMKSVFINYLLPHLKKDANSLRPSMYIENGRRRVDTVIGIPHVHRDKENYLLNTIEFLTETLKNEPKRSVVIIVMIAEIDSAYVLNMSMIIEKKFMEHVASGLLEVLAPSASYYPDLDTLKTTLGDSRKRFKWRTKQNLDALYLMVFAQPKGAYYLMLEDDVIVKPNFFTEMKKFVVTMDEVNPDWIYIAFSNVGGIGKLFKSAEIIPFAAYVQIFYKNMPIDWLLESYLADRACFINKFTKSCGTRKSFIRPQYNSSLFQHVGTYSSLKGKIQNIKDTKFGNITTYYPNKNPPVKFIKTTIKEHADHTAYRLYNGQDFFWGIYPSRGSKLEFWFEKPTPLKRFRFRTGNHEHISDKLSLTDVEVPYVNRTNFTTIGKFDEFGVAEGTFDNDATPVLAIRLVVKEFMRNWVIISEVYLTPFDNDRSDDTYKTRLKS